MSISIFELELELEIDNDLEVIQKQAQAQKSSYVYPELERELENKSFHGYFKYGNNVLVRGYYKPGNYLCHPRERCIMVCDIYFLEQCEMSVVGGYNPYVYSVYKLPNSGHIRSHIFFGDDKFPLLSVHETPYKNIINIKLDREICEREKIWDNKSYRTDTITFFIGDLKNEFYEQ